MPELGVIEHSESPYSSPIVIMTKEDNNFCFCLDVRALNRITVFEAEPMKDANA